MNFLPYGIIRISARETQWIHLWLLWCVVLFIVLFSITEACPVFAATSSLFNYN